MRWVKGLERMRSSENSRTKNKWDGSSVGQSAALTYTVKLSQSMP
jgi:hypothetical protein